jgi:hypothetical protein
MRYTTDDAAHSTTNSAPAGSTTQPGATTHRWLATGSGVENRFIPGPYEPGAHHNQQTGSFVHNVLG